MWVVVARRREKGSWGRGAPPKCGSTQSVVPFKKVEELMNVRGVGEKNFLKLKPQITVGAVKAEGNASNK